MGGWGEHLTGAVPGRARGMLLPGNIDMSYRPVVQNAPTPDDPYVSQSTIRSMSFNDGYGREILIPTVLFGKIMTPQEAMARYHQTGEHLGIFDSPEAADEYAQFIHEQAARGMGMGEQ